MDKTKRDRTSGYKRRSSSTTPANFQPPSSRKSTISSNKQSSGDRSYRSERSRASSFAVKNKKLPVDFAEKVLDLELKIDQGRFTLDTITELMQLYSQAVEYYNGINDDKYTVYQDRI